MKTFLITSLFFLLGMQICVAQWKQTNGPVGGYVSSIVVHDQHLFAGTENGVFRSSDQGLSWLSAGLRDFEINCLINDGTNVYASTERDGVYSSSDQGISWIKVFDVNCKVKCLTVCEPYIFVGTDSNYVYRSNDRGLSWIQLKEGLQSNSIHCLVVLDTILFAATKWGGIHRSTDYGLSWQQTVFVGNAYNISCLVVNGSSFYAAVSFPWASDSFPGDFAVYKSSDSGLSWLKMSGNNLSQIKVKSLTCYKNLLFVGSDSTIYKSTDAGISWCIADSCLEPQKVNCFASDGQNLYAGTMGGGIYYSSDEGSSWTQTKIINTHIESLAHNSAYIFANERECGIFRSGDGGNNWTTIGSLINKRLGYFYKFYSLYTFNTDLIIGNGVNEFYRPTAYRSTNNGANWEEIKVFEGCHVNAFVQKGDSIFAGVGVYSSGGKAGIYLSIDDGFTWEKISGLPAHELAFTDNYIFAAVFVSFGEGNDLYRSNDGGITWNRTVCCSPAYIAATGSKIITICMWGAGICYSTDEGNTWNHNPAFDKYVHTLLVEDNIFFTGTDDGIYLSYDTGVSWVRINEEGLYPGIEIKNFMVSRDTLYAGTDGYGVWRRPLSEIVASAKEENFSTASNSFLLNQNYPNPFNPSTKISWQSPVRNHQILKVFDMLGREVRILINEERETGYNSVEFDASHLPSGVYFYQLNAENFIDIKKMILLK